MISPYKNVLEEHVDSGHPVTVHRNGAPDVQGEVEEVNDHVATLSYMDPEHPGGLRRVHVAYEDMRGIEISDWDYQNL